MPPLWAMDFKSQQDLTRLYKPLGPASCSTDWLSWEEHGPCQCTPPPLPPLQSLLKMEALCLPHTLLSPSPAWPPCLHLTLSVPWLGPLPKKDLSSEPCEACLSLFLHQNQFSLRPYFIDGSLKRGTFSCHREVPIWGVVAAATPFLFSQKPFLKSSHFLVNLLVDLGVPKTLAALSWTVC